LAGFGTAGSLLAGAALLFVLASAVVSFNGWPRVGGQAAPAAVVLPSADHPAGSVAGRRLAAAVAARSGVPSGAGTARAAVAVMTPAAAAVMTPVVGRRVSSVSGGAPALPGQSAPPRPAGSRPCNCDGGHAPGPLGTAVRKTTGAVGGTVAGVGAGAGGAISGATGAVASGVSGVSPGAGAVVGAAGRQAGGAVAGTGAGAGAAVAAAGRALSGALGGLSGR
jgi:hypothetical protein